MTTTLSSNSNGNCFLVYEHIRPDTGAVFYVGKGKPRRARYLIRHNRRHKRIRAKLKQAGLDIEVRIVWRNLPNESSIALEKMRISYLKSIGVDLVNMTEGGEGLCGPSDEVREKLSLAARNRSPEHAARIAAQLKNPTPEVRAKIAAARMGSKASAKTRAKMSEAHKNITQETRDKMSASHKGMKKSDRTRARIAAAKIGDKNPNFGKSASAESRAKMSASHTGEKNHFYGRRHTEESLAKMRAASTGVTPSPENLAKRSATMKAIWLKRKEEKAEK